MIELSIRLVWLIKFTTLMIGQKSKGKGVLNLKVEWGVFKTLCSVLKCMLKHSE